MSQASHLGFPAPAPSCFRHEDAARPRGDRPAIAPARLLRRGVIGPDERQYSVFAARGGAGDREAAPLPPEAALRAHRLRAARPRDPGHGRGRAASRGRAVRPGLGRPALVPVPALRLLAGAHPASASRQEVPAGPGRDHVAAAGQAAARPLCPAADRRGPDAPLPGSERARRRRVPVRQRPGRAERGVHPHPQRPAGRSGRPADDQQARYRARPPVPVRRQHQEPAPGRRRHRRVRAAGGHRGDRALVRQAVGGVPDVRGDDRLHPLRDRRADQRHHRAEGGGVHHQCGCCGLSAVRQAPVRRARWRPGRASRARGGHRVDRDRAGHAEEHPAALVTGPATECAFSTAGSRARERPARRRGGWRPPSGRPGTAARTAGWPVRRGRTG
jgi:hypothetical protein